MFMLKMHQSNNHPLRTELMRYSETNTDVLHGQSDYRQIDHNTVCLMRVLQRFIQMNKIIEIKKKC